MPPPRIVRKLRVPLATLNARDACRCRSCAWVSGSGIVLPRALAGDALSPGQTLVDTFSTRIFWERGWAKKTQKQGREGRRFVAAAGRWRPVAMPARASHLVAHALRAPLVRRVRRARHVRRRAGRIHGRRREHRQGAGWVRAVVTRGRDR